MFEQFISTVDINESYAFKEVLGEGAFAEVRKAIYLEQQKVVAIKCIDKKRIGSQDLMVYKNQCQIMLQLQHPNIVQMYEVYDNEDFFYIVMQYMEGGQLCDQRNLQRCKTESQICQVIKTLTDALDFCHRKGIVHRDIKPQNILWSSKDNDAMLKIADFGFAKISDNGIFTTACGTPLFFSPQIISGKPYDRSVDFWSLGIILFILLSGKTPFEAEDEDHLFDKIKNTNLDFTDSCWKYVSTSAKDLILRLLQKIPSKRYKADDIRRHPWINSDHSEGVQFRDRQANLQSFDADRKIGKLRAIINLTLNDIKHEGILEENENSGSCSN